MRHPHPYLSFLFAAIVWTDTLAEAHAQTLEEWREQTGILRVGVVTGGDPLREKRLEDFTNYLQSSLQWPVDLFAARSGSKLIDAIAAGQIEYAIMSGTAFAAGRLLCDCLEAIASPSTETGQTHIRSVLMSPEDADLINGETQVLMGPSGDFMTHQVPTFFMRVDEGNLAERVATSATVSLPSLEAVATRLAEVGEGAAFGWTYSSGDPDWPDDAVLTGFALTLQTMSPELAPVWMSQPFRLGPHVAHETVPQTVRDQLVAALIAMKDDAPLAFDAVSPRLSGAFQRAENVDYANYAEVIAIVGK